MSYARPDFEADAVKTARTLHVAFRRAQYLQARWNSGINADFPNSGDTIKHNDLMNRVNDLIADYLADGQGKLNQILALSDLTLPGDTE